MKGRLSIALLGLLAGTLAVASGWAQVKQAPGAVPPSVVIPAIAHITGTYYPSGVTTAGVSVHFAATCGGTDIATAPVLHFTSQGGTTLLAYFTVPSSLKTGTYAVWTTGTSPSFGSISCSALNVTNTSTKLESCIPSSSVGVLPGKVVMAYVPNGYWDGGETGVEAVPIEGGGSPTTITTPHAVNACASNPITAETVCTANNTDVYLITGTTLNTTVSSGATGSTGFSGGECLNCGVAINATSNTAYIEIADSSAGSRSGVQALNLVTNTFAAPFGMSEHVSENIAVDSTRNLVLTPGEGGNYTLLSIAPSGSLTEYDKSIGGELDSGAEDCTTGIALASVEFTNDIFIEDLTQAVFTPGTPGIYTAPGQFLDVNPAAGGGYSAGTCGISAVSSSAHLAVVTGEFGGSSFAVLQLPATSGSGTPSLVDYAYAYLPASPDGEVFSAGFDPHTLTTYTSPNNGKAYAVFSDWATGEPKWLAVVDMEALLAAPRSSANFVDPTYNLITNNVVTYFATGL